MKHFEEKIQYTLNLILNDYQNDRTIDTIRNFDLPDNDVLVDILESMKKIVFPGYFRNNSLKIYTVSNQTSMLLEDVIYKLCRQISIALHYNKAYENIPEEEISQKAKSFTLAFLEKVPKIRALIETDVQAAFDGDPAAYNTTEIIYSYPGLSAIFVNRIAHELYLLDIPMIPRIMTEYAHSRTGIDIHPGAEIGAYFFIDHGTGTVIGETTVIGDHVKIYQGVTLGAVSTRGGQKLRNKKRHPTIEDNVTIYSGASILGGDTIIGKNVVVGGNSFITKSIPADTTVRIKNPELQFCTVCNGCINK